MSHLKLLSILLFGLLLASCNRNTNCEQFDDNRFVHENLLDYYLWRQEVPEEVDYCAFETPEETLDFIRYHELDPVHGGYSYIADAADFQSLFNEGQYLGFGFSYLLGVDEVRLRYVFDDSAAGRAGLERGDLILSVDGQSAEQLSATFGWSDAFGPDEEGYPVQMLVRKSDGSTLDVHMEKGIININTVLHHSVIQQGADTVGYLVFNSFLSTSNTELAQVFNEFSAAGVNRLVLDLRYNGGGSVSVANNLASYLKPAAQSNSDLFTRLVYNDRHQDWNHSYYLTPLSDALDLDNLTVITTGSTASASELIINGLRPFINVGTVGSTTYGKPVGQNPTPFADKMLVAVNFEVLNRDNEGGYFDGIAADCPADDGLTYAFGDTDEPMLAEALHLDQIGQCSSVPRAASPRSTPPSRESYSLRNIIGAI